MSENLDFGTQVAGAVDQSDASSIDAQKYCYGDDAANCTSYGGLYQWHTAMGLPFFCSGTGTVTTTTVWLRCRMNTPHRGICPEGWHVPTQAEWATLDSWSDTNNGGVPNDEGTSLKSTNLWRSGAGTDAYGWGGLPAGYRSGWSFVVQGSYGYWWSATEDGAFYAWYRYLSSDIQYLVEHYSLKSRAGFSLRCIKDLP